MIILFKENETKFTNLGLGVLTDALSCIVKEKLNDEFTVELEYPVTGKHFNKIVNNRILYCKPNPYDNMQPFRIFSITKPINNKIIVNAVHISYDLNNLPVNAFAGVNLQDALTKIQNGSLIEHDFKLISGLTSARTFKTTGPYNMRAILLGGENSIVQAYNAEVKFNHFIIEVLSKRGQNRGASVRYGHNMTDINHETSAELLFNGVFPFYHTEKETTETTSSDEFQQTYIVGSKLFQDGWLSYSKDGEPFHPLDTSPVQIATEGEYYQKVYVWNTVYNIFQEKVYNQTVTLIQGVLEPEWITIDWSKFPVIACKASKKGYFKMMTDDDWGDLKGVGDTIFEGNITSSGLMENLILYFSEVIPSNRESTNEDVAEIIDVQLDQPILWIETPDAKAMTHNKIMMLDLSSEFDEEPTKERLQAKAEEYISKNKIGTLKHTTTVSFIDVSASTESDKYENFDHIELGDPVKIVYEDANIEIELRTISTEFDVIGNRYSSIELGEKKDTMSEESIQSGDVVSSLTNDVGYATTTQVNKLIANIVTANYIEALNARLSKAQITQLQVERINVTGIIEASQFSLDTIISKLLVTENAEIAATLSAGEIKVAGNITVKSGSIHIESKDKGTVFNVDVDGNLQANSVSITGGTLVINDGMFEVTNDGSLIAQNAEIKGHIDAISGEIGGFTIEEDKLYSDELGRGVFISPGSEEEASIASSDNISGWSFVAGGKFGVTKNGILYADEAHISGEISIADGSININEGQFVVDQYGVVIIKSGEINIGLIEEKDEEGTIVKTSYAFQVTSDGTVSITSGSLKIGGTSMDPNFSVDQDGVAVANDLTITGGSLRIGGSTYCPNFVVSTDGVLTANEAFISGTIHIMDGEIMMGVTEYDYTEVPMTQQKYRPYIYYYKDENDAYVLDRSSSYTVGRIYYEFVPITSSVYNSYFYVDHFGNMYASSAHISGEVNITSGFIKLGLEYDDTYNFEVSSTGDVIIKSGEINIGRLSELDDNGNVKYAFKVNEDGDVSITSGSISLGNEGGTYIDAQGNIQVGYDSEKKTYAFNLDSYGKLRVSDILFYIDPAGTVSINGETFKVDQVSDKVYIKTCEIDTIATCVSATLDNVYTTNIVNSDTFETSIGYIHESLYFNRSKTLYIQSLETSVSVQQAVNFGVYLTSGSIIDSSGNVYFNVKPIQNNGTVVVTMKSITLEFKMTATIHYKEAFIWDPINHTYVWGAETSTINITKYVYIPSGTTSTDGVNDHIHVDFLKIKNVDYITVNAIVAEFNNPVILEYYEDVSDILKLSGALIPASDEDTLHTLGMEDYPWHKLFLLNGYRQYNDATYSEYNKSEYIEQSFNSWIKYQQSTPSNPALFRIGLSSKTTDINDYSSYSDNSRLELHSQGGLELNAYGLPIKLNASKYISAKMFGVSLNLNRQGLFIDPTLVSGDRTIMDRAALDNRFAVDPLNDQSGPWGLQVLLMPETSGGGTWSYTFHSSKVHIYAVNVQEYGSYGGGNYNMLFCKIVDDTSQISTASKNRIEVKNANSGRTVSGWVWLLICYSH